MGGAMASVGWAVDAPLRRGDDLAAAAAGVDLLVLAVPDRVVDEVSSEVTPVATTVVVHLAGSLGLEVLAGHPRRGAVHPLVSLPDAAVGQARLLDNAWFAVAGDPLAAEVVADLGGRAFEVADEDRVVYHAAAVAASNHLVALMGQVERMAAGIGVPGEAYLDLARATLDNVAALGPAAALTGPVARGDWATVARHLKALEGLDEADAAVYRSLASAAKRLVDGDPDLPADLRAAGRMEP